MEIVEREKEMKTCKILQEDNNEPESLYVLTFEIFIKILSFHYKVQLFQMIQLLTRV